MPGHREKIWYEDRVNNIIELKEYFSKNPGAGPLVGYGGKKSHHVFALEARIAFEWIDAIDSFTRVEFEHVNIFASFLKEYPVLGNAVGYSPK
jgi:hypothetical protein